MKIGATTNQLIKIRVVLAYSNIICFKTSLIDRLDCFNGF